MTYQFAKGYPKGEFLLPSVTKIIGDFSDKSKVRALTQWSANQVVAWVKLNCAKTKGNFPHYRVNDEQLNQARFNFRDVSDTALEVGSAVHKLAEEYLLAGVHKKTTRFSISKDQSVKNGFDAFLTWMDENKVEPIAVEETVYSDYSAGTLDLRCWLQMKEWSMRKMYVIDFKTSKAIYASDYGPQIAAYRAAKQKELQEEWDGYDKENFSGIYEASLITGCGILRLDKETGLPEWKDFSDRYEKDLKVFNKMVELYMLRHKIIANKAGWKESV